MNKDALKQIITMISNNVEIAVYTTLATLIKELQKKEMNAEDQLAYIAEVLKRRADELQKGFSKNASNKD